MFICLAALAMNLLFNRSHPEVLTILSQFMVSCQKWQSTIVSGGGRGQKKEKKRHNNNRKANPLLYKMVTLEFPLYSLK